MKKLVYLYKSAATKNIYHLKEQLYSKVWSLCISHMLKLVKCLLLMFIMKLY